MTTVLNQALILTLIGMGMTFAAIGLLVLGMIVMTAVIRETPVKRRRAVVVEVERDPQSEAVAREVTAAVFPGVTVAQGTVLAGDSTHDDSRDGDRYRAAAAAVAIALAVQATGTAPVAAQPVFVAVDGWSAFVRSRRLAQHRSGLRSR